MLFVRYPDLLKRLVAVLLGIPLQSIEYFQTINTEMPPEEIGKKFCRLDINMMVGGKRVNLEIQVEDEGNYPERSMFHIDSIDTTSEKDLWLALFNAETEEELEKLVSSGGEVMVQAVEAYRGITATEEFKHLEILRARTRHDEAQAIMNAERRGAEAEREKWKDEKDQLDAENELLRQQLATFQANQKS